MAAQTKHDVQISLIPNSHSRPLLRTGTLGDLIRIRNLASSSYLSVVGDALTLVDAATLDEHTDEYVHEALLFRLVRRGGLGPEVHANPDQPGHDAAHSGAPHPATSGLDEIFRVHGCHGEDRPGKGYQRSPRQRPRRARTCAPGPVSRHDAHR